MAARRIWAVTAYDVTDGTMPETDQMLPSTNGYYDQDWIPDDVVKL